METKHPKYEVLDSVDSSQPPPLVASPHTSADTSEVPPLPESSKLSKASSHGAASGSALERDAKRTRDVTAAAAAELDGADDRPKPSPAVTSAVVCICNMFAEDQTVLIDLHKFASLFENFPSSGRGITGVSYGDIHKGFQKKAAKQFAHQAQLRLSLDGAENVVVKMFKTGQMQTCGCPSVETSMKAVRIVVQALNDLIGMGGGEGLLRWSGIGGAGEMPVATLAPEKLEVKVVNTNCSFDGGFLERGYGVNLERLVSLLSRPEVAQEVERVEFDPHSHYAGAKVYFRPSQSPDNKNNNNRRSVFVGVFPSSKCVITGAASYAVAAEAYVFMSSFLVDSYLELRVRMSPVSILSRKSNKRRRKASPPASAAAASAAALPSSSSAAAGAAAAAAAARPVLPPPPIKAAVSASSGSSAQLAKRPAAGAPEGGGGGKGGGSTLEIQLQLPDGKQAVTLRRSITSAETLASVREWVAAEAHKLNVSTEWVRALAFVGARDRIVSEQDETLTLATSILPQVKMAQLEMAQAAEALLAGLRA
mmetsp:Transcript_15793/g.37753  ORF Transcript_15793/g.37753 Transcript_15793/m.37753 type:complete len:537 (-) Transcript_15793:101-1711(-)